MSSFRWGNAFEVFRDLEREMDRLLRSVNLNFDGLRPGQSYPPVNIYESETEYLLTAELPGASVEELDLNVADGLVTIRGGRQNDPDIPAERFRRSERIVGRWERQFSLPSRVIEEEMYAELNHGVLKLHFPKAASSQPRQIPVWDAGRDDAESGADG